MVKPPMPQNWYTERLGALSPYHEIPREFVIVCDCL
jgi:hypothetical protein